MGNTVSLIIWGSGDAVGSHVEARFAPRVLDVRKARRREQLPAVPAVLDCAEDRLQVDRAVPRRGREGLCDKSRRPLSSPRRSSAEVEGAALAVRQAHPAWGGRKIRQVIEREGIETPAASTITAILRHGGRRWERSGAAIRRGPAFEHAAPNDLWQMDFKGHVGLVDGGRLHPLTVLDDHSRYAIVLRACADQKTQTVREALVDAFRRYGLPRALITDNGSPWGDGPGSPLRRWACFSSTRVSASPIRGLTTLNDGQGRALPPVPEGRSARRPAFRYVGGGGARPRALARCL